MKYDKCFALAKEAGIEEAELYIGESFSLSISLFLFKYSYSLYDLRFKGLVVPVSS